MRHIRHVPGRLVFALAAAAILGCAVPEADAGSGIPQSGAEVDAASVYQPRPQPGGTLDAAKKNLADVLGGRQKPFGVKYYGRSGINYFMATSVPVLEDGIEVGPRLAFPYTELRDRPIAVVKSREAYPYLVHLGMVSFHFNDLAQAQRFADSMYSVQQAQKRTDDERFSQFESAAAHYRALKVKPPVSEEQRKLIVQANAMNQEKEYADAIGLYLKAVDLDPVSYPAAYFNLALLSAQVNRFNAAVSYMKQYLLLEPDAKDARSAQDKIYEWELMMKRKKE